MANGLTPSEGFLVPEVVAMPNGLRLVHIQDSNSRVGTAGVCVRAGSADEADDEYGIAHFVEHTIFKGTGTLKASEIIHRMEDVGGELNAYTTSEATVVYSTFPAEYAGRAFELIADLVTDSRFPHAELVKEKRVVLDELNSYLDSPADAIFDEFEDLVFAGCGYGHNILGTRQSVRSFRSANCLSFVNRFYRAPNMVAFYCGPASAEDVVAVAGRFFAGLNSEPVTTTRTLTKVAPRFDKRRFLPLHQAHVLLGAVVDTPTPQWRYAAALFANIIGGPGMNSLLNVELRERRGLVYNVEASNTFLNGGKCLLTVYFGCDEADLPECRSLCAKVFADLASIPEEDLAAARSQFLGQRTIAVENRESRIISAARSTLFHGSPESDEAVRRGILAVSREDLAALSRQMLNCSSLNFLPKK